MRVFLTGATGFIGSAITQELLRNGHQVLGLARSEVAAQSLISAGAQVHRGDLNDIDSLRRGASDCDGVIHTGFIHDFTRFKEVCEVDRHAIEALGAALKGSNRPLIVTSGTALVSPGRVATETMKAALNADSHPRVESEIITSALSQHGIRVSVVRLSPSVHGTGDHGFVPMLINLAQEKGVSAYIGDGENSWTAVHRFDAALLYRLALEKGAENATYHGVAEQSIAFRDIAGAIGKHLNLPVVSMTPEDAAQHFGWFSAFTGLDCPASSTLTRTALDWNPVQAGLLADMAYADYFTK